MHIDRLAGSADLEGVLEIDRLSFPSPWTRAMYEEELRQPATSFIIVARTGAAPVAGYCSYRVVADELQINNVAVRPDHRGKGIGRALVEAVLDHGRASGAADGAARGAALERGGAGSSMPVSVSWRPESGPATTRTPRKMRWCWPGMSGILKRIRKLESA